MIGAEIVQQASMAGLLITLSSGDNLKIVGKQDCIEKWASTIQSNKGGILIALNNLVFRYTEQCCLGLDVEAQEVIDRLLSIEDEQDIISGQIPMESLRLHIEVWKKAGKPHYSGKDLANREIL
ncbi:hypothetical protein [Legionella feeleii]|uniref:Uncharacterized protein n=1 Tax=Legionella feeleii TaxID=453 RepID=A0A0W0U406_9GAMM|nr:hypothetical protein [Legionella feeleii]KTD02656.1 hypothetical protein Lfee_0811 [Legionella feeleii]SPX61212.1 Uncharacterised protein [Legionella feeleii]